MLQQFACAFLLLVCSVSLVEPQQPIENDVGDNVVCVTCIKKVVGVHTIVMNNKTDFLLIASLKKSCDYLSKESKELVRAFLE